MTVYIIKNDNYKYQELTLGIHDFIDLIPEKYDDLYIAKFNFNNMSLNKWWSNIHSSFKTIEDEPEAPIPDISVWIGATLALSPKAYSILHDLLSPFGEFLPVTCGNDTFHIFNCLTFGMVDEINSKQNLQYIEGEPEGIYMGIKKLLFNKVDIQKKEIFKTKFNYCQDSFCNENFKNTVEKNNLKGIVFKDNLASMF